MIFSVAEIDEDKNGHSWKISGVTTTGLQETKLTKSILEGTSASGRKFGDLGSILVNSILLTDEYDKAHDSIGYGGFVLGCYDQAVQQVQPSH